MRRSQGSLEQGDGPTMGKAWHCFVEVVQKEQTSSSRFLLSAKSSVAYASCLLFHLTDNIFLLFFRLARKPTKKLYLMLYSMFFNFPRSTVEWHLGLSVTFWHKGAFYFRRSAVECHLWLSVTSRYKSAIHVRDIEVVVRTRELVIFFVTFRNASVHCKTSKETTVYLIGSNNFILLEVLSKKADANHPHSLIQGH